METIEQWKPIQGFEGLYEVSNKGRVKSLNNYHRIEKEKLLKFQDNHGYYKVVLSKNCKQKKFLVHRLVAEAFIPNPDNLPCINHRDETRTNNCVENLEWCSWKYNANYGSHNDKVKEKLSTKIKCLDLQLNEINYYPSIQEASRQLDIYAYTIWRSIYKYKSPYKKRYIFSEIKEQDI